MQPEVVVPLKKYLWKNKPGIYYFRRVVPKDLQQYLQVIELRRSLRTMDYENAIVRCQKYVEASEQYFHAQRKKHNLVADSLEEFLSGVEGNLDPVPIVTELSRKNRLENTALISAVNRNEQLSLNNLSARESDFSDLCEKFIASNKNARNWNSPKTETSYRNTFKLFEKFFQNKSVEQYSIDDADQFRHYIQNIPTGWLRQADTRDLDYQDVIRLDKPKMTDSGVSDHLVRIKAFFEFLKRRRFVEFNIFDDIGVKSTRNSRTPFTKPELQHLFKRDNFARFQREGCPSHYWIPLLAAWTGARRGELFYLTPDDIKEKSGIWVIQITAERGKRVKTAFSIRDIPIHRKLIELGFLEFCEQKREKNQLEPLFPEYKVFQKQAGYKFSNVFKDWIQSTKDQLPDNQKKLFKEYRGLHSFRHLFIKEMREVGVPRNVARKLAGHRASEDAHDSYGGPPTEAQQKRELIQNNIELQRLDIASYFPQLPVYIDLCQKKEI